MENQHLFSKWSFCYAHSNKEKRERENKCIHLAYKCARLHIPRHHLLSEVHSFPKASLFENHSLLGTNNVRWQIPENNFPPNGVLNSFIWITQKKNFTVVRNVICAPFPRQQMDVVHSATPVHACHTCFYLVVTLASLSLRLRWSGTTLLQCRCHMLHCPYRRYSSCQRCPELCSLHTLICNMAKTELKNVCACPKLTCQYIATVNIC